MKMQYKSSVQLALSSLVAFVALAAGAPTYSHLVVRQQDVTQIHNIVLPTFVKINVVNSLDLPGDGVDHQDRNLRSDGSIDDPARSAAKFRMTLISDKVEPWPLEPYTVASTVRLAAVTDSTTGEVIEKPCALVHGVFTCDLHRWFKPEEIDNLPSTATDFRILHQDPAVEPIEVRNAQLLGRLEMGRTEVLTSIAMIAQPALVQIFAFN
ncbi:hypothetical protein BKA62DRAFT_829217 [Auriculariales sp. MPI-PUGE-AT-0066]|nr:hypothetical protein BKA62DRAFT_829217 [Auriculariales sp. MPI-PUGE-AT-0066]